MIKFSILILPKHVVWKSICWVRQTRHVAKATADDYLRIYLIFKIFLK